MANRRCDWCGNRILYFVELCQLADNDMGRVIELHARCWEELGKPWFTEYVKESEDPGVNTKPNDKFLDAIERKLTLGVPPLTIAEQQRLFAIAAGREIAMKKRCQFCNATGRYFGHGCRDCGGTGYVQRGK